MQEQRSEDQDQDRGSEVSQRVHEKAILGVLLSEPGPWSLEELVREFDGDRLGTEDAAKDLAARGLLHRLGGFYFPTVAARRIDEIGLD